MNSYSLLGIISSIALFLPVALVIILKLFSNRSFFALSLYYFVVGAQNLMRKAYLVRLNGSTQSMSLVDNILDAPSHAFVSYFFQYFCINE